MIKAPERPHTSDVPKFCIMWAHLAWVITAKGWNIKSCQKFSLCIVWEDTHWSHLRNTQELRVKMPSSLFPHLVPKAQQIARKVGASCWGAITEQFPEKAALEEVFEGGIGVSQTDKTRTFQKGGATLEACSETGKVCNEEVQWESEWRVHQRGLYLGS